MSSKFKIVQIVFAFVYLILFKYLYIFICLLGLFFISLFIISYCFITLKILQKKTYITPIIILSIMLFIPLHYVSFLEITILNILIGIIYFSKFNKTFKS